jgi:hypothetical protein
MFKSFFSPISIDEELMRRWEKIIN